jgi:histidyl-tRNA synthetase
VPNCQPLIEKAPSILDSLSPDAAKHFESVRGYLDVMGQAYTVTPRLVRGLDYYVRTTFEVKTADLGAQDAVAGGGRYDGLIERLGGPPDPGIGFAIGLERVVLLLGDAETASRPFVLLVPLGDQALQCLMPITRAVRQGGVAAELGYGARKLPRELERANKLGVAYAVIAGENELAAGEAVLREMKTGEQRRVPIAALAAELCALAAKSVSS